MRIHPSSINSQLSVPEPPPGVAGDCPIILFEEITRGEAQLYVRQCTLASPHALLLVAAHLALSQENTQDDDSAGLLPVQCFVVSLVTVCCIALLFLVQHLVVPTTMQ